MKKLTVWSNNFTGKNNNINLKIIWSQDMATHLILRKKNPGDPSDNEAFPNLPVVNISQVFQQQVGLMLAQMHFH